jgi:hypothetical protein
MRFWHIAYCVDGREVRESSRSEDREVAKELLAERIRAKGSGQLFDKVTGRAFRYGRRGHGGVYFLQAKTGGPIKIGIARNIVARMTEIQSSMPEELVCLGVMLGAGRNEERRLHRFFSDSWIRGEWFRPTDDLLKWIERCSIKIKIEPKRKRASCVTVKAGLIVVRGGPPILGACQACEDLGTQCEACQTWNQTTGRTDSA